MAEVEYSNELSAIYDVTSKPLQVNDSLKSQEYIGEFQLKT
jgi:hypothetical protein